MESRETRRCGVRSRLDGSLEWKLWAPKAKSVELVLIDGNQRRGFAMTRDKLGFFTHTAANIPDGQRYAFRLDGGDARPDPASLWQPDGPFGPSAVVRPERFTWTDRGWKGVPRQDLVFYELHVGTFTPEGTFEAIIPRLPELRDLGVTAIEIMPVAQFPGTRNWGYDGVLFYATQNSYGGPAGLQRLVDACHAAGLAIFLDVVYNHVGPEGNLLGEFGPYYNDRYKTPWGPALNYDGPGSDAVRDMVIDNTRMWLEEFHFDGLRLDAVHAIFDLSPRHLLRAIQEAAEDVARRSRRATHIIAESDMNDPRLMVGLERGGYGLDAAWSDDFHHAVHAFLTGETQGYYEDFGPAEDIARVLESPYLYAGTYSPHRQRKHGAPPGDLAGDRFVVAIQNHDQVGNRARGDRFGSLLPPAKQRLAASLLLFAPHLPLLFMGEEYGEDRPFQFFCSFIDEKLVNAVREGRKKEFAAFQWQGEVPDPQSEATFRASGLSWNWSDPTKAGLRRLYADLLHARRTWPALRDYTRRKARFERGIVEFERGSGAERLQVFFNLTTEATTMPTTPVGSSCLFRSEAAKYGGTPNEGRLVSFECVAFGHAAGV
jgi:maltooligosyltrehalose trehalohydrolase